MKVKEENEKPGLKLNIQNLSLLHLVPLSKANRWGKSKSSDRFYFLGLQNHYGWWLQPQNCGLLLGRKAMRNLDSVLKSRVISFPTKVHRVKAMVFSVVMYGCESWIIKKAEHQRIDAFELWCWRRLLRVPWTPRKSKQSKGNHPWIFFRRPDSELKLQCSGHLMWKTDSLEKSLMFGKVESKRGRGQQRINRQQRRLFSITNAMYINLSKLWETVKDRGAWHTSVHGVAKSQTWLKD